MSADRILVVDDEPAVLRALTVALEAHDYEVVAASTGEAAVARAADSSPRVIVLDLGLPGIDGLEVIRRVRAFLAATPIVVLSAWGDDAVKVEALDLGADDYVAKPFAMPELLARLRVALRHADRSDGAAAESAVLHRGDIEIDVPDRRVRVRGAEVPLTRTQFALLLLFARHPARVLTHRTIVDAVWGDPDAADAANLRVFISQLRRRIEPDPHRPRRIVTDPGVGYRFVPSEDGEG